MAGPSDAERRRGQPRRPGRGSAPGLTLLALAGLALLSRGALAGASEAADPDLRLLSSGQTRGYRGNRAEPADGNRDDGDLIRGRPFDLAYSAVLTPTDAIDNLVVDRATGLMWVRRLGLLDAPDARGPHGNHVLDRSYGWEEALALAADFRYAGFTDWRLPNIHELQSLVDFGHWAPAMDPRAFPEPFEALPSSYFWSSTTSPVDAREAYYGNVLDGHAWPWHKAIGFAVRPVRSLTAAEREAWGVAEEPGRVALFATGQTRRYQGDREREAPGGGDDGDLRLGLTQDYAWHDDGRIDSADENLVLDRHTGLVWLRRPQLLDGQGGPTGLGGNVDLGQPLDWQTAVERCNALDYAGRADWRLPNIRELDSLAQYGRAGGPLDPAAFPGPPLPSGDGQQPPWIWWSSTTNVRPRSGFTAADEAWYLSFGPPLKRHHVFDAQPDSAKSREGHVRCVRDAVAAALPEGWRAEIRGSADWQAMSLGSAQPEIVRQGKFLLPLEADRPEAPFAAAFQEVSRYPLHLDFLRAAFPTIFGGLTPTDYTSLVSRRASRRYFAGSLREFDSAGLGRVYGFDVYVDDADPAELLDEAELTALFRRLGRAFRRRPLVYAPTQPGAQDQARAWSGGALPVAFPAPGPAADYAVYTPGEAYGRLRRLTLDALHEAGGAGDLSWQDILVLDRAPTDVDGVVAAIVTGEPQGELSHLNVRAARRGTPNAYVADAHAMFAAYEGRLVRLTLSRDGWELEPDVDPEAAAAFWASRRPPPVDVPAIDASALAILDLPDIAAAERDGDAVTRVGAKAANLARLYTVIPAEHQLPGLAIPFGYYARFMADNRIFDPELQPPASRSLAEQVIRLHAEPRFHADPAWRAERLARLRDAIRDGAVPDAWEAEIEARLIETFGPFRMVRFRSSSNAEDGLTFNGAGLYDSTSVCAEDGSDGDSDGPSRCDPAAPEERTIKRGLRKVWASLWNQRAWEERAWYGVDPLALGMALLVTPAFTDERANGVAFTGNPLAPGAPEMLVNAQIGDTSVVLPEPGLLPERDLLLISEGRLSGIRRLQASSLLPTGGQVLSDALLGRMASLMLQVAADYPLDTGDLPRSAVMLDLEFKVDGPEQRIALKQVRPFVAAPEPGAEPPAFLRVSVPNTLTLCSGWRLPYPIADEHAERLRLVLPAGGLELPLDPGDRPGTLFGALEAGPRLAPASALEPGRLALRAVVGRPELRELRASRRYAVAAVPLADGGRSSEAVTLTLALGGIRAGEPNLRRLDAEALSLSVQVTASRGERAAQTLTPCGMPGRPDVRLELDLADSQSLRLRLRYAEPPGASPVGQAQLLGATVDLAEGATQVEDPRQLVYDADRHNWNERFWVLFDPPIGASGGLEIASTGIPGRPETTWLARTLDRDLAPGREIAVRSVRRIDRPPDALSPRYLPWLGSSRGSPPTAPSAGQP
ncbi:MAG: DUF1566 domain-containing protein [Chloroflexi bacterium]|nr:DUF1566 domain-containing protein [Chloroflexota bacterium]